MLKFIIYSRRSKVRKDGVQHTHETAEWQVMQYLKTLDAKGIAYEVIDHVAEDITGYGYYTKRPLFTKIVNLCKKDKSLTLLASKHDRIARDSWTGSELLKTINMVVATHPDADDFTHQILFSTAEKEVKNTSDRWKYMYKAKKAACEAKGEVLQWGANSDKYKQNENNATKRNKREALSRSEHLRQPLTLVINSLSKVTFKNIAEALTAAKVLLPSGVEGEWKPSQVSRVMERLEISRF